MGATGRGPGLTHRRPRTAYRGDMTAAEQTQRGPEVPRVLGRYTLGRRLGEGGMGVVHHATRDDGRQVAVKVLRPHIAHDPDARRRLDREVATLARVDSPRVAAVLDADTQGPAPYIVTAYVPGVPLDTVVQEQGPVGGPALVRLGRGLLEALEAIHRVGIVHRDLKPGNVLMVGRDPVVIDFGIAQVADDVRLTMTGMVMGTPGYLSPEVVEGGAVTRATDQWGWAATLAFAASGQPPFGRGPMPVVLDRVVRGRTQLDGVDPQLRPLLAAALNPDPRRRPSSAEIMQALELYAAHRPVTAALAQQPEVAGSSPWPATPAGERGRSGDSWAAVPPTARHEPVDRTMVQPIPPTPQTRVQPESAPPGGYEFGAGQPYGAPGGSPLGDRPGHPQARPDAPSRPGPYDPRRLEPYAPPRPGPYAPSAGDRPPYPRGDGDPRIGRAPRTGTLAAALVLFVGLSAVLPLVGWAVLGLWSVAARTTDHALTALVLRRHESGRRRSDVPVLIAMSPWHLVRAALTTGLALLLPLAFAVATTVISAVLMTELGVLAVSYDDAVPIAFGSLLGAVVAWWGPGGLSLRRGSRTVARAMLPSSVATTVGVTALLIGGAALLGWSVTEATAVSWWPMTDGRAPFSELIPQVLQR